MGNLGPAESELQLLASLEPEADVVELGCGTAAVSAWLARRGVRPVAVDFARTQIDAVDTPPARVRRLVPRSVLERRAALVRGRELDLALSKYGVSLWSDPSRWPPEGHASCGPAAA